jgi:uncharacterized protein
MNEKLKGCLKGFENKYPHQMEARFSRVLEKIADLWGTPALEQYFSELLIADRPGRQGFPPEVAREIFTLSMVYDDINAQSRAKEDTWHMEMAEAKDELENLGLKFSPDEMMKAVESADASRVILFLNAGMPVDVRDSREWTPLMVAAFHGREEAAQALIEHGASIHAQDKQGYTPLHWAALSGYDAVVNLLIDKRANVNSRSAHGLTPLLQAAAKGHAWVVAQLLAVGADANAASDDGATPLQKALANEHKAVVVALLEGGASS